MEVVEQRHHLDVSVGVVGADDLGVELEVLTQAPGLVAAYWVRIDGKGRSMGIFETEDAARAVADRVPQMLTDAVTLESVDVGEVVESA